MAYAHLADTNAWTGTPDLERILAIFEPSFAGPLVANAGIGPSDAAKLVERGRVAAVAFGRMFLANPDLPNRIRAGGPYNSMRSEGVYGGSHVGYTDYPHAEEP